MSTNHTTTRQRLKVDAKITLKTVGVREMRRGRGAAFGAGDDRRWARGAAHGSAAAREAARKEAEARVELEAHAAPQGSGAAMAARGLTPLPHAR